MGLFERWLQAGSLLSPIGIMLSEVSGGGHRECHVQPDWLLIYYVDDERLVLTLTRTGTHADLFGL